MPIWRAAAWLMSITRPREKGPRSLMRTTTLSPFATLVTRTMLPKGSERAWSAVSRDVLAGNNVVDVRAVGFEADQLAVTIEPQTPDA